MPNLKLILPPSPGWTRVPNYLLDRLLPNLKDSELRVLLVVLRQTYGWQQPNRKVNLRYRYLIKKTGRQSEALARALRSLEERGLIHTIKFPAQQSGSNPKSEGLETEQHTKKNN